MAENTAIEWADATVNFWAGCTKVSPACDHCYAERMAGRLWGVKWGTGQPREQFAGAPAMLQALDRKAQREGRRLRVFINSLSDVFDNEVDPAWRRDLFALIEKTPNLDFLLLTKRIGNVQSMVPLGWLASSLHGPGGRVVHAYGWPDHVWLGATICNQEEADRDIPKLFRVPAPKCFLSIEPMLSDVAIWRWAAPHCERHPGKLEPDGKCEVCEGRGIWGIPGADQLGEHEKAPIRLGLDWVIVGGESGPKARPMHPDWVRSLRDQCNEAGVPFFFKQWGEWAPPTKLEDMRNLGDMMRAGRAIHVYGAGREHDGHFRQGDEHLLRVGKKAAGRLLDGREWNEVPA